jgi:[ribosomal protein S5]-alanine N-acetyltransferase
MPDLILRPWKFSDLPSLVRHAGDPAIAANMTDTFPHPYTIAAGEAFIQRVCGLTPAMVMAIEVEGEAAGSIGIFPLHDIFRRNAELGYWLSTRHWGKGIMTEALRRHVDHTFDNFPEIERIFARPFGSNLASQRVLDKAGFLLEAKCKGTIIKNGRIEDELVYAIRR